MKTNLQEWKAKHGRIFKVRLEGKEVYFRLLTAGEILYYRKNPKQVSTNINKFIVNDESLGLTGSKIKLGDFIIRLSFPESDEKLRERILHYKFKVKDDFILNLIAKLCSVFLSYTPEQLQEKTFEQLLELASIAELITGKAILTDKKMKGFKVPDFQPGTKFHQPEVDTLMAESQDALGQALAKAGKVVKTFSEVKKQKTPTVPVTDLQKQMRELNEML